MIPRALRLIERLHQERTNENEDALVLLRDGEQVPYTYSSTLFRQYREIAKLPDDVPFHGLRHSFAVMCRLAGVDILDLKDLMRHRKIEQTMTYAQFGPALLKQKVLKAFETKETHVHNM